MLALILALLLAGCTAAQPALSPTVTTAPVPTATDTAHPSSTATGMPTPTLTATPRLSYPSSTPPATMPLVPTLVATPEAALVGASSTGQHPEYPQMGNGGYDIQHVTLDIAVDMRRETFDATALLDIRSTQDLQRFYLDFAGLQVYGVFVDDVPVLFTPEPLDLEITLPEPLPDDTLFHVKVRYGGIPGVVGNPELRDRADYQDAVTFYGFGVLIWGEPAGAASWFPANMDLTDRATYTYHVTVAKPWVVAANGTLTGVEDNGDTQTYTWEANDPLLAYLATIAIGHFTLVEGETDDGIPLRSYIQEDASDEVFQIVDQTSEMIRAFESYFGPFPFETYGIVFHNNPPLGGGLESQTLTNINGQIHDDLLAHELAHQWFGDSVALANWNDLWLKEGLATYAGEYLWTEYTEGTDMAETVFQQRVMNQVAAQTPIVVRPYDAERGKGIIAAYNRGAMTFYALRRLVGDDTFFAILQAYYARYRGRNASTEDFIAVAEEISGRDLTDFFNGWLYQEQVPDMP